MEPDIADRSVRRETMALFSNQRVVLRETSRAVTPFGGVAVCAILGGRMQVVPTKVPRMALLPVLVSQSKLLKGLEARAGIEPAHKGFAVFRTTPKSL